VKSDSVEQPPRPQGLLRYRWVLAIALVVVLVGLIHATGLGERLDSVERVRTWVLGAGGWGLALFLGLFALGALAHMPGVLFLAAAMFIYPSWQGGVVAFVGAVLAVTVSFLVFRSVGGQPLGGLRQPLLRRVLRHLDDRPIRTVFLLRLILWLAPVVSSALALSSVRLRDYVVGSALGLALPIAAFALLFDFILRSGWLQQFL
jgi:uncharacterized membrane protein YdjX (TVP38/TMEM64 family)